VRIAVPRERSASTVEWFVSMVTSLVAVFSVIASIYYYSMTFCPPVTVMTGLACVLKADAMAPRAEMWLIIAGVFGLAGALSYPMKRLGGASFTRARLFKPSSLEGEATGWKARLFVPLLLAGYAALQLTEILFVPGGNKPYSDPQAFYIPAALDILSGTKCSPSPYSSTCNYEHPPLDKLFLALSIKVFGQNFTGYSIFPLLFGAGSLLLTYGIALEVSGQKVARYAAIFLLIDGTFLGINDQAWTDVPMVFFGLFGVYVLLKVRNKRQLTWAAISGALLGLSILSKETGVLFVVAAIACALWLTRNITVKRLVVLLGVTALVAAGGLQIYDMLLTPFPTFIAHIQYILHYNSLIGLPGWPQESWLPFLGKSVVPLAWLIFYPPFGFISTMPEEWLLLASLPAVLYLIGWKSSSLSELERRTILFIPLWLASTYAFYFFAQLFRSTYPFYMIQMLPAAVIADGWMMTKFTRPMKILFILGCLGWLYVFFPMSSTAIPVLTYVSKWISCVGSACPGGI